MLCYNIVLKSEYDCVLCIEVTDFRKYNLLFLMFMTFEFLTNGGVCDSDGVTIFVGL